MRRSSVKDRFDGPILTQLLSIHTRYTFAPTTSGRRKVSFTWLNLPLGSVARVGGVVGGVIGGVTFHFAFLHGTAGKVPYMVPYIIMAAATTDICHCSGLASLPLHRPYVKISRYGTATTPPEAASLCPRERHWLAQGPRHPHAPATRSDGRSMDVENKNLSLGISSFSPFYSPLRNSPVGCLQLLSQPRPSLSKQRSPSAVHTWTLSSCSQEKKQTFVSRFRG